MYGVYNLEINIDKTDQFILSYNYSHKSYVRATQLENDVLKQDAKPRDNIYLIVDVTRSKEELTNMPSDLVEEKIIKYFISDFSFTGSYYHNNTSRSFTSENILLASNVEITNWTMNVISPLNPIEKKTLYFISSSDENVIKINDNLTSIKTLNEGTSEVKVSTSAGISKTFTFNVGKLPPKSIIINCEDKVKIGELIDLSISVEPNDSLNEVTWSISNNEIAELVYQNNEVKLKGKKRGFVSLKATSTSDSNIVSEKTIYVSEGELSIEQLKSDLLGTWIHSLYSGSFTFEFKNNNQVVVTDTYRGITSKISCIATYEFIQENDENCTHSSSFSDFKNSDYYIIKLTVIEMTDSPAYQIDDFHLAFAKDGSELIFHCTANNYTLNYLLTKNN